MTTNEQNRNRIPGFTLADRLRKARELTGLEQGPFAERALISRTTVVNYEQGHRKPRELYLRSWADAAGVDLHWLITGEGDTTEAELTYSEPWAIAS